MNPRYAKVVLVHVPLDPDENTKEVLNLGSKGHKRVESQNLKECYEGIATKEIRMEERNIYCGAYNVLVLQDMWVALVIHLEDIYFSNSLIIHHVNTKKTTTVKEVWGVFHLQKILENFYWEFWEFPFGKRAFHLSQVPFVYKPLSIASPKNQMPW